MKWGARTTSRGQRPHPSARENGRTSARKLVDECLAKTGDNAGEGARTFIHVDAKAAIDAAAAMDRLRHVQAAPPPFEDSKLALQHLVAISAQLPRTR